MDPIKGLSIESLALLKGLDPSDVYAYGCTNGFIGDSRCIRIPYRDAGGETTSLKARLEDGSARWLRGSPSLYGLEHLYLWPDEAAILLVEGETDCWAAWRHGVAALGVPGATSWKDAWIPFLHNRRLFVWEEPDAGGQTLIVRLARALPQCRVIGGDSTTKDLCQLQQRETFRLPEVLLEMMAKSLPIRSRAVALLNQTSPEFVNLLHRSPSNEGTRRSEFDMLLQRAREVDLPMFFDSRGFRIRKARGDFKMTCPFPDHDDGTPSFSIFRKLNGSWHWHCFGCSRAGDAIAFVQQFHEIDFVTAVHEVVS